MTNDTNAGLVTLFAESGLDQAQLQPVSPLWTPPHASTARAAWAGSYPNQPDIKIHVEAAAFAGKPVYFEIFYAWDEPREQTFTSGTFQGSRSGGATARQSSSQ